MKHTIKTSLTYLMLLLVISCKKESNSIQSSDINRQSLTPAISADIAESNILSSITIGTQHWMTKDLTVSHYRNGDTIPEVKSNAAWATLTTGAWCWYDNNPTYGKLYNWYAVNDPRGLAPEGWHIPSHSELDNLTIFLGGVTLAGGKLKEAGKRHWIPPNTDATNTTGFTALPGGYRSSMGRYYHIGLQGFWWTTTEYISSYYAFYHSLYYASSNFFYGWSPENYGYSVRCLRN